MNTLVGFFTNALAGHISNELIIFIISLMPILELRGGLLAASMLNVPYLRALIICVIGNILPIPFLLLLIEHIILLLEKSGPTKKIAAFLRGKVDKNQEAILKYGFWGLTVFVGIPLPGTGAWTGSIAAALLHIKTRAAVPAILLGVMLAAAIMSIISYGILGFFLH